MGETILYAWIGGSGLLVCAYMIGVLRGYDRGRRRGEGDARRSIGDALRSTNRFGLFANPCHFARGADNDAAMDAVRAHQDALRCAMIDAGLSDPRPGWVFPTYYVPIESASRVRPERSHQQEGDARFTAVDELMPHIVEVSDD